MIKLERDRQVVPAAFRAKRRLDKALALLKAYDQGKGKLEFTSKNSYWKAAKDQLKAESHGKCAYCEAPTDTVAHGDVEHFRPKSVYWWLAYCYDNYLFSCQICNQSYKGDEFPIRGTPMKLVPVLPKKLPAGDDKVAALATRLAPDPLAGPMDPAMVKFLKAAAREKPGLVDAYAVDPEPLFRWVADSALKEVRIAPRRARGLSRWAFDSVEKFLGLNRDELLRVRWKTYSILETYKKLLDSEALPEAERKMVRDRILEMMQPDWPFAGMVRYFVRAEWRLSLD